MNILHLPWLELAIANTGLGSLCVSRIRDPDHAYRWGLALHRHILCCAVLAWLAFYVSMPPDSLARWSVQSAVMGRQIFALDELNAPTLADSRAVAFPGRTFDRADIHAAVFVRMVAGSRDNPSPHIQLQGAVDFDCLAGVIDRAAIFGVAQSP